MAVVVIVVAVSIFGFVATRHSNEQQARALLQNDTEQAAALASSILSGVGSSLDSLATAVNLSGGSPTEFESQAKPFAQGGLSVALVDHTASQPTVAAVVGGGLRAGQVLTGPLAEVVRKAGAALAAAPVVRRGDRSTAGFAIGPPLVPAGTALYLAFSVNPFTITPVTAGRPFDNLHVALYGSTRPASSNLLVATTRHLPLTGEMARAVVPVGTSNWTLLAVARSPLTGSFATSAPYIILFLGIVVGLVIGVTVEVLVRRQRYATQLVAERTGDLERSLQELHTAQRALVRTERLSALGEMASVVGHELRNPLAAVTNALFLVRRKVGDPVPDALEGHLAMAERETAKAARLAEDLTAFVRPRTQTMERVALDEVLEEVVQSTPPPPEVALSLEVEPHTVRADRTQIAEVLTNLLTNAYEAVPGGGAVRVELHRNGAGAVLSVEDDGEGIDPASADRLFEPFFTTKATGTGLGLAIVRRLVDAHGGTIAITGVGRGGARVEVRLPDDGGGTPADDPTA
ncbi:MAG TPA: ATP-binding protein [Acidimicrobiales bacterium]|nr:ATP-binding protein [Acidimicrobiales bacterium]